MEYLVEGHLGSYYISNKDPKVIEQYCEQCDDSDVILTSWDPTPKNARLNALLRYFMSNVLNTREDIYNKALQKSFESCWHGIDIVYLLLNDIEYNNEKVYIIASDLHEKNYISDEEYYKIMHISNFEEKRQINMVKHYEESMFTIDTETGERAIRLTK